MLVRRVLLSEHNKKVTILENAFFLEKVFVLLIKFLIGMIVDIDFNCLSEFIDIEENSVILLDGLIVVKVGLNFDYSFVLQVGIFQQY